MPKIRSLLFLKVVLIIIVDVLAKDKYTDENRPYEFGFNIDGEQHRHEKKDVNGIIMGEFGFITADGVYHVTVYATDENGGFKILSMKNIRLMPFPTKRLQTTAPATAKPTTPPIMRLEASVNARSRNASEVQTPDIQQYTQRACSSCSLPPKQMTGFISEPSKPTTLVGKSSPSSKPTKQRTSIENQKLNGTISRPGHRKARINNSNANSNQPTSDRRDHNDVNNHSSKHTDHLANPLSETLSEFNNKQRLVPGQRQARIDNPDLKTNQITSGLKIYEDNIKSSKYENNLENPIKKISSINNKPSLGSDRGQARIDNPELNTNQVTSGIKNTNDNKATKYEDNLVNPIKKTPNLNNKPRLVSGKISSSEKTDYSGDNGLPKGLTVEDMKRLLYRFNYTVGFHGHHEDGYTNGDKVGDYFVNNRDGTQQKIDYLANEFGYQPNITRVEIGLNSSKIPKKDTEKNKEFGLKGYEFKWFHVPKYHNL